MMPIMIGTVFTEILLSSIWFPYTKSLVFTNKLIMQQKKQRLRGSSSFSKLTELVSDKATSITESVVSNY